MDDNENRVLGKMEIMRRLPDSCVNMEEPGGASYDRIIVVIGCIMSYHHHTCNSHVHGRNVKISNIFKGTTD